MPTPTPAEVKIAMVAARSAKESVGYKKKRDMKDENTALIDTLQASYL